jgi:hypothetical protein
MTNQFRFLNDYPKSFTADGFKFTLLDSTEALVAEGKALQNALANPIHHHVFIGPKIGAAYRVDTQQGERINIGVKPNGEVWNIVLRHNAAPNPDTQKAIKEAFARAWAQSEDSSPTRLSQKIFLLEAELAKAYHNRAGLIQWGQNGYVLAAWCTICGKNQVNPQAGEDTCPTCLHA